MPPSRLSPDLVLIGNCDLTMGERQNRSVLVLVLVLCCGYARRQPIDEGGFKLDLTSKATAGPNLSGVRFASLAHPSLFVNLNVVC